MVTSSGNSTDLYDQSYDLEVPRECDKLCQFLFALCLNFSLW